MQTKVIDYGYTVENQLLLRIVIDCTTRCWNWSGLRNSDGYGHVYYPEARKTTGAHRYFYKQLVGPIPQGLTIDHLCRNRACVNPDHLEPVTLRENILRGESPHAKMARKISCPQGHLLAGANLRHGESYRRCRTCANTNARERYRNDPKYRKKQCRKGAYYTRRAGLEDE